MNAATWDGFADELARDPVAVQTLFERHKPNAAGRCVSCTTGGTGQAETRWPCVLYSVAQTAQTRARAAAREAEQQ